jgi:hypothetical protein
MLKVADAALQLDFLDTVPRLRGESGVLSVHGEKLATWRFDKLGGLGSWVKNLFRRRAAMKAAPSAGVIDDAETAFAGRARRPPSRGENRAAERNMAGIPPRQTGGGAGAAAGGAPPPPNAKGMSPAAKWGLGAGAGGLAAGYYLGSPSAPQQPLQQYGQPGETPYGAYGTGMTPGGGF